MTTCPLDCGADIEPRAVDVRVHDAGRVTVFICPECLGVAIDAAVLCDPRRPLDLSRLLRPVVESIRRENSIDPLTQTKNRAFFFKRLAAEITAAHHRSFISVAAFVFDLNGVYDKHGSRCGDAMMQSLAASLASAIRVGDDLARVEPDTFGLILRNADETTARSIAARIADGVRVVMPGNSHPLPVPLIVEAMPADGGEAETVWRDLMARVRLLPGRAGLETCS
jgi:diguanylate cyclase (GGDEF)-like protein